MIRNALGLIEIVGLAAALEAADAAVKAANVSLLGYELTKGGGMVTIKLTGDVGAVQAAVEAGRAAASKVNTVYACHVIPRPHQELDCMVNSKENIGGTVAVAETPCAVTVIPAAAMEPSTPPAVETVPEDAVDATSYEPDETVEVAEEGLVELVEISADDQELATEKPTVKADGDACNLCNDPACTRKKGEPRTTCLHFGRLAKESE